MKKLLIISSFLLAFVLSACQKDFPLESPTSDELCLICFPGQRDTTIIQLYATVPIGGKYEGSKYLKAADISFSVDGASLPVQQASEPVGSVPKGCWFVPGTVAEGHQVEIRAAVQDKPSIVATTIIPDQVPTFEYKLHSYGIEVFFEDDSSSEDFYGLALACEQTLEKDGKKKITIHNVEPISEGNGTKEISVVQEYYDTGFSGWSLWPKKAALYGVRIWPDKKFNGTKARLAMQIGSAHFGGSGYDADYDAEMEGASETRRYKLLLYRFSKEFFKYMASLDYQAYNDYASYGIVPVIPSYTNVAGGCGILAGWSVRETGWFVLNE